MIHMKSFRYEVRSPVYDDARLPFWREEPIPADGPCNYDPTDLLSAATHAKRCHGWVVAVTEEIVYEPHDGDGVEVPDRQESTMAYPPPGCESP